MNLKDKVALVTGSSSGLGLVFAQTLVERGMHVYGLARRQEPMDTLREKVGERFHPVSCDVRDEKQVKEAVDRAIQEQNRIDVLINNAGLGRFAPAAEAGIGERHRSGSVYAPARHDDSRRSAAHRSAQHSW